MPKVAPSARPTTPGTPPVIPSTLEPPLLHLSLGSPYPFPRANYHYLDPHTAILRQIQRHLGILLPPEHAIPIPSEPTDPPQGPPLVERTMPPKELTTGEIEPSIPSIPTSTAEPSSPHDPPTTI
ncbi:hypothetical protein CK203_057467 [Vitis vinifera]|uniref:Uncharacterized protein n=1 Tax=Vitis vinifera TaxID=29760 RepID=A0A438GLD8_VITVI|nr:hypothetical protein CK203_057467 [Vitis vinifera]